MSNAKDVWVRKTDDEVAQAIASIGEYTEEGRQIILAEATRRGLDAVAPPPPPQHRPTLTQSYVKGWAKLVVFKGRASRRECFTFGIANYMISIVLIMSGFFRVGEVFLVVAVLGQLPINVRRLHDAGRSGWWLLLSLIPFVGWIGVLALLLQNSESSGNEHGVLD